VRTRTATDAQVAQLVEQRIENPRVAGSIPALGTISPKSVGLFVRASFPGLAPGEEQSFSHPFKCIQPPHTGIEQRMRNGECKMAWL
jgi:hypothetical protein